MTDLDYPDLFPTPPTSFATDAPEATGSGTPGTDAVATYVDENRSWLFYLAEISLRRTIDDVQWLFYHGGEDYWVNNVHLLVRQHAEADKQITLWYSHLPPSIRFEPPKPPENEFAFYMQYRFLEWRESTLRPLLYVFLHYRPLGGAPLPREVMQGGREAVSVIAELITLSTQHHRHGGIWFVARRAFGCALLLLAVVLRYGEAEAPPAWPDLIALALQTLERWASEAADVAIMRNVLERVYSAVRQQHSAC